MIESQRTRTLDKINAAVLTIIIGMSMAILYFTLVEPTDAPRYRAEGAAQVVNTMKPLVDAKGREYEARIAELEAQLMECCAYE